MTDEQPPGKSRSLLKSVATVATGSVVASLVGLLASPVITRVFAPSEFGLFSLVLALVMTVSTVANLRFDLALPLPERQEDANGILALCLLASMFTVAVVALTVAIVPAGFRGSVPLHLLVWAPVMLAPVGLFQALNAAAIRHSMYRAIATRNALQATVTAGSQIALGLAGVGVLGLVIGYIVGQSFGVLSLALQTRALSGLRKLGRPISGLAREYKRFPLLLAPTGFVNSLGQQAPLILVGVTYGVGPAGLLALVQRVLAVPTSLLGQSTAQVYISELARARRSGDLTRAREVFGATSRALCALAIVLVVAVAPTAPWLFGRLFGSEWTASGVIASILSFAMAAQLVGSPVSMTLTVFDRIPLVAVWDFARLTSVSAAIVGPWTLGWPFEAAVVCLSSVLTALYLGYWLLSRQTLIAATLTVGTHSS